MIRIAAAIPYALFALGLAYGVRAQERETCVNPKGFTLSADALGLAIEEHARWVMNSKSGQRALWCNLEITSIDLRGLDLRGVDLRMAKLPGADFAGARLDGALLKQADLRKSNFRGAILRKTDLSAASLIKANLTNANLQKAVLKNARFDDAKMAGADLGNAGFERTSFKGVDLRSTVGLTAAEHARLAPGSVKPPALTTPHASPTVQAGGAPTLVAAATGVGLRKRSTQEGAAWEGGVQGPVGFIQKREVRASYPSANVLEVPRHIR